MDARVVATERLLGGIRGVGGVLVAKNDAGSYVAFVSIKESTSFPGERFLVQLRTSDRKVQAPRGGSNSPARFQAKRGRLETF